MTLPVTDFLLLLFAGSRFFPELHSMNSFLHVNGNILPADKEIITASNRGLRYGDGLFETIKVVQGEIPLMALHADRLMHGLSVLQIPLPAAYSLPNLTEQIIQLCDINNTLHAARVRVAVYRGNGTLYSVNDQAPYVIIQADPFPDAYKTLNETGYTIDIYPHVQKSGDILSNLKTNNYLPYVMAALQAQQQQLNDCLVLNTQGRICDTTIANLFWIQDRHIYTPPLSEGGVAGVMRRYLLTVLPHAGYVVDEKPCTADDLQQADEVFLTNALYGIRWVGQFRQKMYSRQLIAQLYDQFVKTMVSTQLL